MEPELFTGLRSADRALQAQLLLRLFDVAQVGVFSGGGSTIDADVETQALILQLESQTISDPALESFAIAVYAG